MRLLLKIGGTLLDSAGSRSSLAIQLGSLRSQGHLCVVVHGGGKQMTRFLDERGIESRFIEGLRVSTPETMDAVLKVLAGSVNQELVAALIACGVPAVGLTGVDGNLVEAKQMSVELGAVGRVTRSDPKLLEVLLAASFLPVVACVAGDRNGNFYNVNGDLMAVACAAAFHADRLIFLTDVPGVLDGEGRLLTSLTPAQASHLIATGVARGGMQAKLNAAMSALEQGIGAVCIVPGQEESILSRVLSDPAVPGTTLTEEGLK